MSSTIQPIYGNLSNLTTSVVIATNTRSVSQTDYSYFKSDGVYEKRLNGLLNYLNEILGKNYSLTSNGLDSEKIFDECTLTINCNAGKKAYSYYLKEVLQKLNFLNQHILKGQEAYNALSSKTLTETQINNYRTILEIEDKIIQKYLEDFSKYTIVQTLITNRESIRKNITTQKPIKNSAESTEMNYEIEFKAWNEEGSFKEGLKEFKDLNALRTLTTNKYGGYQTITTTLCNTKIYKENLASGLSENKAAEESMTDLNDKFGFNVVTKSITAMPTETSPIALFDELTLLEKLKYITVYYKDTTSPHYFYPNNEKSGIPCMSRTELLQYIPNTNENEGNSDELLDLGIIPLYTTAPKTDITETGAIELFYIGYLEDSQGAINALAKFMEIKSVALLSQVTQQSYRIKALKFYLKMLETASQELNRSYSGDVISTKAYLAIKYAAANQTRTLITIDNEDYIVVQLDKYQTGTEEEKKLIEISNTNKKPFHYLSKNNAYILIKANETGIQDFLNLDYNAVDNFFNPQKDPDNPVKQTNLELNNITDSINGVNIYKKVTITVSQMIIFKDSVLENDNIRFVQFPETNDLDADTNNDSANSKAVEFLPKELETPKTKMDELLKNAGGTSLRWDNATLSEEEEKEEINKDSIWPGFVDMWQKVCSTAIENVNSQIDSVNKTIKSLRSKVDTYDSSSSRFRDKFYSTTMTVINKFS